MIPPIFHLCSAMSDMVKVYTSSLVFMETVNTTCMFLFREEGPIMIFHLPPHLLFLSKHVPRCSKHLKLVFRLPPPPAHTHLEWLHETQYFRSPYSPYLASYSRSIHQFNWPRSIKRSKAVHLLSLSEIVTVVRLGLKVTPTSEVVRLTKKFSEPSISRSSMIGMSMHISCRSFAVLNERVVEIWL